MSKIMEEFDEKDDLNLFDQLAINRTQTGLATFLLDHDWKSLAMKSRSLLESKKA